MTTESWWPASPYVYKPCEHHGKAVQVGPYKVLASGTMYLKAADLMKADVLVPLVTTMPSQFIGKCLTVLAIPMTDFGGVPKGWKKLLMRRVIPLLASGKKVLAFCAGSHGRTGCFLASLIALLESPEETPDPIAAARERHCSHAVETRDQAIAVFALRGQELPEKYDREFPPRPVTYPTTVVSGANFKSTAIPSVIPSGREDEEAWKG